MKTNTPALPPKIKQMLSEHSYVLSADNCEDLIPYLTSTENYGPTKRGIVVPLLVSFFRNCTLEQLSGQEKVFKENINQPIFQQLLFSTEEFMAKNQPYEKTKLLLEWGWDANQLYEVKNYRTHDGVGYRYPENATLLHVLNSPKILELLIKHGASTTAKCRIHTHLQPLINAGIKEIKTPQDLNVLLDILVKDKNNGDYFKKMRPIYKDWSNWNTQMFLATHNQDLKTLQKEFTPYEFAIENKQKKKYLFLRNYENQDNISTEQKNKIIKITEEIKNKKFNKAQKLLLAEIKNKNPYALDNIDNLKPIVNAELLFKSIRSNDNLWVKAIVETGWVNKDAVSKVGHKESLLMCAMGRNKPTIFKYLDSMGYNHEIENVVNKLNEELTLWSKSTDYDGKLRTPEEILTYMPSGIIYYLAKKGYTFNNEKVMKLVIELEKDKLEESISAMPSVETSTKKKFKL